MVDQPVRVELAQVRRAAQLLLDHLEQVAGGVVEVDKDYFWSIAPEELYDVYQEPGELTVGQVSESLGWLGAIAEERSPAIGHGLVWLADVARALGHSVPQ